MHDIFQNSWVVGIGGGLITGFIFYFITKFSISKKSNVDYYRQIDLANLEVIRVLKPYIADNGLPDKDIIIAIISAIARKYKIKPNEMYSIRIFCEELIKEIIDNVYVSNEKKKEYSMQLKQYIEEVERNSFEILKSSEVVISPLNEHRMQRDTIKWISLVMGFMASVFTIIIVIITANETMQITTLNFFEVALMIVTSVTAIAVTMNLLKRLKRGKRDNFKD